MTTNNNEDKKFKCQSCGNEWDNNNRMYGVTRACEEINIETVIKKAIAQDRKERAETQKQRVDEYFATKGAGTWHEIHQDIISLISE